MNTAESNLQLNKLYAGPGVKYECTAYRGTVELTCLWELEHEQGGEGQLFPGCNEVRCSQGASCESLRLGRGPLTFADNYDLNDLQVRVMKGFRHRTLIENGDILEVGDPKPDGFVIWFGLANVKPLE
ncbi:MAG TPA: hypothetical protein EYQ75_08995 [Planctomycetaceae bacterium]|nr:hypothetical protein [Planctomycetaceae bacterium]